MAPPLDVLILAAGEGKRMKSATPKVLLDVLGRPMVGHVIAAARALKPRRIVVIGGRRLPEIKAACASEAGLVFARQPKPLGTAHAVQHGLRAVAADDGDVVVLSGDVPLVTPQTLRALVRAHRRASAAITMLTAVVPDPAGLGRVVRAPDGTLLRVVEERDADADVRQIREINSGVYAFQRAALEAWLPRVGRQNAQGEYYLTDVLRLAREDGARVALVAASDHAEIAGINRPSELAAVRVSLRRRILEYHEARGVIIAAPDLTYIESGVSIGAGARIEPFSVIRATATIAAFSRVGPFAHVRPGTRVERGAEIGNFVEVKATRLGARSKALHLAYLGDAEIGPDANIGAGTITANFDGKKKHRTRIGPGAFVGSGTVLVAPVKVGGRARTGAGAIVLADMDVPPGATAVGVPARVVSKKKRTGRSPR